MCEALPAFDAGRSLSVSQVVQRVARGAATGCRLGKCKTRRLAVLMMKFLASALTRPRQCLSAVLCYRQVHTCSHTLVCPCVWTCACVPAYTNTCVHTYVHLYTRVHMSVYMHIHAGTCIPMYTKCVCAHGCSHACTHVPMYIHKHASTRVPTYTNTRVPIYTCMHVWLSTPEAALGQWCAWSWVCLCTLQGACLGRTCTPPALPVAALSFSPPSVCVVSSFFSH